MQSSHFSRAVSSFYSITAGRVISIAGCFFIRPAHLSTRTKQRKRPPSPSQRRRTGAFAVSSHFRSKNNPFEQEHRCTKIGQVDRTE